MGQQWVDSPPDARDSTVVAASRAGANVGWCWVELSRRLGTNLELIIDPSVVEVMRSCNAHFRAAKSIWYLLR